MTIAERKSAEPDVALSRRALLGGGVAGALVIFASSAAWLRGQSRPPLLRATRPAMGTRAEVLLAYPGPQAPALVRAALAEIAAVETRMTRFDPESEVGRVNAHPGRLFPVSPMTGEVVRTALEIARASDGRFDPAMGAWEEAWGFHDHRPPGRMPHPNELPLVAGGPPYQRVELAGDARHPRLRVSETAVQLDLGGIAKGYAVDRAVALLRAHGVRHALVNVGGDLHALGGHPEGRPWQVGVRHPRRNDRFLTVLSLRDGAVATSGDYERFFLAGGRRYHHLLDPRTGRPARFHRSVTVTAPSSMTADALATAAFATEPAAARRLLRRLAPEGWITVDGEGAIERNRTGA